MKNQIRKIEFTSKRVGANINFKVDVKVKESFLQRLSNLFKSERIVSVWMEESQASSASNYLYNEIKKLKKSFVVKTEEPKEDWEINMEKAVGVKVETEKKTKSAKPAAEGSEPSKPKRRYSRKPKKDQKPQSEN